MSEGTFCRVEVHVCFESNKQDFIFSSLKNDNFPVILFFKFSYLLLKHILWIHVRTDSTTHKPVTKSTHIRCFESKIRQIGIPLFGYIKVGYEGVYTSRTCFPDELGIILP